MGKTFVTEVERVHDLHTTPRDNRIRVVETEDYRVLYKGQGVGGVVSVKGNSEEEAIANATALLRKSIPSCIHLDLKMV